MVRSLGDIYSQFVLTTDGLITRFNTPVPSSEPFSQSCPPVHDDGRSLLIIYLQNSWGDFCFELILACATGNQLTAGGTQIIPLPDVDNASDARLKVKAVARETAENLGTTYPVWHSSSFVSEVSRSLPLTIQSELVLLFGALDTPRLITGVRNYIVHPSKDNEIKFKKVAQEMGNPGVNPSELLRLRVRGGASTFEAWIKQLQQTANSAIQ